MASLGVRSFARDAALIAGAATVSTLVSATVMPLVALVQKWVRELLSLNSPYAKFIFDFTWGGIVGSTVKVLTAPFNVVSETHRYLTIRSYVCDVPPPGTLVDQCFSMYESGFLANAIIDTRVLGKPSQFHGKDKDFPEFKHGLVAYLGCLNPDLPEMMEQSAAEANPIEVHRLNEAASKLTKQLYFVLSMLCKGKALTLYSMTN